MTTKVGQDAKPVLSSYTFDDNFFELRNAAILRAPQLKATVADEIFSEALSCAPDETSEILGDIWKNRPSMV